MGTIKFEGVGTGWQIDIYDKLSVEKLGYLKVLIQKRIEQFEKLYSRFRFDSYTNITLNQVGTFTLPPDAEPLFSLYHELYQITNGLFTPFIAQVLVDAGYDALYSFKSKVLHTPPKWNEVMDYHYPTVTIKKPEMLDFGAAGKGYVIDLVSDVIKEYEVRSFCIDAGGDIRYENIKPLRVGLENPLDMNQAIGVAEISNVSLCASSGSRRTWGMYHHIIDPKTLSSSSKITATWVVAKSTLLADALATCLFLTKPSSLLPHYSFEYLVLLQDSSFEKSSGFPAELFLR